MDLSIADTDLSPAQLSRRGLMRGVGLLGAGAAAVSENGFDGAVKGAGDPTPANEALAAAGIQFLGNAVRQGRVEGALFLANHPARRGIDSPHEFRLWRDADPSVAIGMEGAPGHQAAGIPAPHGTAARPSS